MPQTNTQLRANLASGLAPNKTVAAGGGGEVVTVTLRFMGVAFKPIDFIDALETKYGAGKVSSPRDSQQLYGDLDLQIDP